MTLAEIAKRAGYKRAQQISNIERGEDSLPYRRALRLAAVIEADPKVFLATAPPPKTRRKTTDRGRTSERGG